ncbi:fructose-specific PTS transporter subunit EIIC [Rothia sp. 88186D007BW]
MTSPTSSPPRILAITACPTGIAHTYMAAENLAAAAEEKGINLKVETHGSIGVEGAFTADDIKEADAILICADIDVDKSRFAGKKLLATPVAQAIKNPQALLTQAQTAPIYQEGRAQTDQENTQKPTKQSIGQQLYQALMNGVSHMIPFVVTGGLMIAVALSLGGTPSTEGLVVPEDSFWNTLLQMGVLAFSLMVPVLSAFIASAIAGRPGLAPGFITGLIAVTGSLYGSEAGAGFIGGILTGFLSGYLALAIKKIPVNRYLATIWPILIIPIVTTAVVGFLFVYLLGHPISLLFEALTQWLAHLDGASVLVLGAVLGAMIAFDMGGPFNKTAFLFAGGMITAGNAAPMGMAATAIAVPPIAVGIATLIRRQVFSKAEQESGIAALLMGFFGITEGAIPLAAARPLQVIPANVLGGATAGALAGLWQVKDNVMHGGPIVAVLGAVDNTLFFFLALLAGVATTVVLMLALIHISNRSSSPAISKTEEDSTQNTAGSMRSETTLTPKAHHEHQSAAELIESDLILLDDQAPTGSPDTVIRGLVDAASARFSNPQAVIEAALAREEKTSTAVGHGVAIPHARTAAVVTPTLAFARLPEGIDWKAPDQSPVRLVFLIAVPESSGNEHLRILSTLARALMRDSFRQQLLTAPDQESVEQAIQQVIVQTKTPAS